MEYPILDETVIRNFSEEQRQKYFSIYLRNARALVDGIQKDLDLNNMEVLQKRMHKLKGSSLAIGASAVQFAAHDIEAAIKNGEIVKTELIEKLRLEFSRLESLIESNYAIIP
jgi:HPt (histidine-containing phosphotransfer) domain-containing protein